MVTYAPFAIFLGAVATVALAFYASWGALSRNASDTFKGFSDLFDRAGIKRRPEEHMLTWLIATAVLWILTALLLHPTPLVGLLLIPIAAAAAGGLFALYTKFKLFRRTEAFIEQLEVVLRLMASGLRTGLGLRQSLAMVIAETEDPARHEYSRVLGQTNIGVSIYDALDDLAARIDRNETTMMARVIRIQSQTGGDLGKVLEHLASTIKERRRLHRKVHALTAEGRAGALVLEGLPLLLGAFICFSQPRMAHALLFTGPGHAVLIIIAILEVLGIISLNQILKVNV